MGKLATCRAVSKTYPYNNPHSIFNPAEKYKIDLKYSHIAKQPEPNIKSYL